ncbi:MAG: NAD(P)H-binding protein [Caulobacterales bacterium]|nr:NAD(P)H-binding protein [Caulobacterales bacterium]
MAGTVLILGASGFIGGHLAAAFASAGWTVRAGARRPEAARRLAPGYDWVRAEFASLTELKAWEPLLDGVDAVINCVGVLQDGPGDSHAVAHVEGPSALIAACEAADLRRLIHVSAAGADDEAGTAYARSKAEMERRVAASGLDWIILRPSLVMARASYGGTAMLRGLAAFPGAIPVLGGDQTFRPVAMADLCAATVQLAEPGAPSSRTFDVGGPDVVTQRRLLLALRGWLGLPPAPIIRIPEWLAWPAVKIGDGLGLLGWSSSFRTTSVRQMAHGAAGGTSEDLTAATGVSPRGFDAILAADSASTADRWQARLYFVRPLAVVVLGLFWIVTGLVTLGPGFQAAKQHLVTAGFGEALAWHGTFWGGWFDVIMGLALWVRSWTRMVSLAMVAATLGYLVGATIWAPQLWLDPLGPWLKVLPMMVLCLFVAATDDRR